MTYTPKAGEGYQVVIDDTNKLLRVPMEMTVEVVAIVGEDVWFTVDGDNALRFCLTQGDSNKWLRVLQDIWTYAALNRRRKRRSA